MTVQFELRTELSLPRHEAFDLSRSIDAHVGSMARSRERAIAGVTSGLIGHGQQVTWRAAHFGIPFRLTTMITSLDAPNSFVDEQVRGPFRRFRHEHRFTESGNGERTTMVDLVTFDAPFGPLGRLVEKVVLGRYLRRLIERRNTYLAGIRFSD
ncbi:SRPBCC family protein [Salinibacterium sp. ZJ454]|uniref:SRPBCC family protein n=1 Tax=Salinibacterium sp. ZJ454 TaxID=2708339 RepID=UPI00142292E7|nr:SRPBCC family protein [Salinibacterium sp. ZJ454]